MQPYVLLYICSKSLLSPPPRHPHFFGSVHRRINSVSMTDGKGFGCDFCLLCLILRIWVLTVSFTFQDFMKYNESRLQQLPCQIFDPIPLGEGAGVGLMKGVDSMAMPEGSTLYDLIQTGLNYTHASVGVVVRLRKELSLIKDVPVLIAIDQVIKKLHSFSVFYSSLNDSVLAQTHM